MNEEPAQPHLPCRDTSPPLWFPGADAIDRLERRRSAPFGDRTPPAGTPAVA
jgi:hypothetical protein